MAEPILEVKGLKTYFYTEEGVLPGVDGLDFTLEQGKVLAIVGESGCGKSVDPAHRSVAARTHHRRGNPL